MYCLLFCGSIDSALTEGGGDCLGNDTEPSNARLVQHGVTLLCLKQRHKQRVVLVDEDTPLIGTARGTPLPSDHQGRACIGAKLCFALAFLF